VSRCKCDGVKGMRRVLLLLTVLRCHLRFQAAAHCQPANCCTNNSVPLLLLLLSCVVVCCQVSVAEGHPTP
jgi:hypothetical protein